eukprot:TRINITY_DN29533_c0_g2_i1.p1 TRINITY_DN29533_c0_g2~~TRINITY_DN29533_c0_g2_i1.p1  ORF type:complete len:372 (+),score=55.64 TRINITY_DN29533_c0_g2_i1:139-1254(+)
MAARPVMLGILFTVLAGVAVTAEMVFSVSMLQLKWPYWRITAFSCVLCMLAVAGCEAVLQSPLPAKPQMKWVSLMGLFSALYWGLGVAAVQIGVDPGDVAALTSINIVVAAIMGRVFLNEPFRLLHLIAVVFSLTGALLIARPAFLFAASESRAAWYGYCCAILSGFLQGVFFIAARKSGDVSAGHLTISALLFSGIYCAFLPYSPMVEEAAIGVALAAPVEAAGWTVVAFLTTIASAFFSSAGSKLCPAAISATVYTASSMFFGYLVQTFLFGATPEAMTVIGALLMFTAVSLMALAGRAAPAPEAEDIVTTEEKEMTPETATSTVTDDETESLASFIASEFSDFSAQEQPVRFRGRRDQVPAEQIGASI